MSAVKVENISKVYKLYDSPSSRLKEALHPFRKKYHHDFYALKDVSFEVEEGETLGIIGKNGSGKSTLLKIITNVLTPTGGVVTVKGKISALLELGAGFNPEFTGIENIYFHSSIMEYSKQEIDERLDNIIAFADIGDFIHQPIKTYSSGMLVRLAFAVASNIDPDILVVDEALAVGDEAFQRKCFAKIQAIQENGATVIFVSHAAGTILELCKRAILLDLGEIVLEGSPKLVVTQYHKLIYSNKERYNRIRKEIKALNQHPTLKRNFEIEAKNNKNSSLTETETDSQKAPKNQHAFYVSTLQSKSMVEYKNYNVDIYDVKITTLHNEKVNILVMDEEYIYSYQVRFNIDVKKVVFGMMFKNLKGIEIGGAIYPRLNNYIEQIKSGEIYLIEWYFKCNLLPGTYCTNVGVMGEIEGKREFLNRMVDVMIFKVQDIPERMYQVGFVHFNQKPFCYKI